MHLPDRKGLEGLPLKILITVMIMALSAQPLFGSLSYLAYSQNLGRAVQEAESIKKSALSAFVGGPGNVRKVAVQLGEGSAFSIRLGGGEGEGRSRAIDVLYRGDLAATVTLGGQGLCIISREGKDVMIEGEMELILTCIESTDGDVVVAGIL